MKKENILTSSIEVNRTSMLKEVRKQTFKTLEFKTNPMYLSLKLGKTIAQPANGWAKAEVSMSMPCYPEEASEVYNEVKMKVLDLLKEQIMSIEQENETIRRKLEY